MLPWITKLAYGQHLARPWDSVMVRRTHKKKSKFTIRKKINVTQIGSYILQLLLSQMCSIPSA